MDDYVARRAVIDTIATKPDLTGDVRCALYARVRAIEPADVRPVVLCRDCIHWKTYPSPTGDQKYCSVFDWINSSTGMDYCSFAERREVLTMTNADRIRAMSDRQLVDLFVLGQYNGAEIIPCPTDTSECRLKDCRQCWTDWLRKEADT